MAFKAPKPMSEAIARDDGKQVTVSSAGSKGFQTVLFNMRMPIPLKEELAAYAAANYTRMSTVVTDALVEYLERRGYHKGA